MMKVQFYHYCYNLINYSQYIKIISNCNTLVAKILLWEILVSYTML